MNTALDQITRLTGRAKADSIWIKELERGAQSSSVYNGVSIYFSSCFKVCELIRKRFIGRGRVLGEAISTASSVNY